MAQAAKVFVVSRPTLANHLESGKISGEKVDGAWQLDRAELQRVYKFRNAKTANALHEDLPANAPLATDALQAEIKLLQAKLEAAQNLAAERALHLEDLRKLLERPAPAPTRRWWQR